MNTYLITTGHSVFQLLADSYSVENNTIQFFKENKSICAITEPCTVIMADYMGGTPLSKDDIEKIKKEFKDSLRRYR